MAVLLLSAFSVSDSSAQSCQAFFDNAEFEAFNEGHGKFLKGVETFEESNIGWDRIVGLPNPLEGNVPNVNGLGIGFPTGLEQKNIVIQDNITAGCSPPNPNPGAHKESILLAGAPGWANSEKVGANSFVASTDLIFPNPEDNHTGVGFELGFLAPFPVTSYFVTVYAKEDEAQIGVFTVPVPGPEPNKTFFGIWCEVSIGRINICSEDDFGIEMVDDIQMWEEDPAAGITDDPVVSVTAGEVTLSAAKPNPFNPVTKITYALPSALRVRLSVYDAFGRAISHLANGPEAPGEHELLWDATAFPSGVYFLQLEAGGRVKTQRLALIK